ncbi:uncharacterized protein LOC143282684 [Babylonia areolata]|uniref:uncharacterized protein LOC143282684 n=1 Tax=Babylonia areolata TaxID=304850 RepID=UPI003FD3A89D
MEPTERNATDPGQSLYMHKIVQQVSHEERVESDREPPLSPDLRAISTFGREFRLMCPICLQDLKQPKQLKSCYHILCKDCLAPFMDEAEGGNVICPLPRCGISCPMEDISRAMGADTYLHAFQGQVSVYVESGEVCCSRPDHDPPVPAAYFCLECGQNLCDTCHSDHSGMEDKRNHHLLKLFRTPATMTVGITRSSDSLAASSVDEGDSASSFKCPICRNTDNCDHEVWLNDLLDDSFRKKNECEIPEHANGRELIAYCTDTNCEKPICRNCSSIEHKTHKTINIGRAMEMKKPELSAVKKTLIFQEEIFKGATESCAKAEAHFRKHIQEVEQQMIERKGAMHMQVENAFNDAYNRIEQMGRKQVELNRQSEEMRQEQQFLKTAIQLADGALQKGASSLEIVRVWKGLQFILDELGGEGRQMKSKSHGSEVVLPQKIVEKNLVLPSPSCMNPDLRILQKVGVESKVLTLAFKLKAEAELLLFYSILPLTDTEALVSCKPAGSAVAVVQYSNLLRVTPERQRCSIPLAERGDNCCITAVPGNGIVATLYSSAGGYGDAKGRNQVLFWDQALGVSMTELQAKGFGEAVRTLAETELPPRGVAVTRDNHLVVCTARDQGEAAQIVMMTLQGDTLCQTRLNSATGDRPDGLQFPRHVTVNINDDICVTDEKDKSVTIFSGRLERRKIRIINPYDKQAYNNRFCPRGICHDSFGRLIIADPNNHAIIRIEYSEGELEPLVQVILENNRDGVKDLDSPTLVQIGQGPRLWVVCRSNIQVFHYMDTE